MKTQTVNTIATANPITISNPMNAYRKFIVWADRMDYYRLIILVGTILFQGCVTAPFAMWSMDAVVGYNELQMFIITISSFAILVPNLSVQPMRITIPIFVICTLLQLAVIVANVSALF